MTQPEAPISLDLDASGYITGLGRAEQSTDSFISSAGRLNATTSLAAKGLAAAVPGRLALAGMVAFAAASANAQKQLAPLAAASKTTGANFETLAKGSRQLARELPVGAAGARQIVTAMTQLGVATKGNEVQVVGLAKAYTRLGAANSESPVALAQAMTQLSRATNSGGSVERVTKLGDSLTTVAAKSGSSALGVAQFSKAISSSAQSSGIGATKILGIASAFTKMGEDGFGAATAFNKMAGDLQRSVREGTPDIAKYAAILGKTNTEVKALFQADPTEAITQVTEKIAAAGQNAPRLLESIGLEGGRNQRIISQLVQSGGLRQGVNDAVGGYGSGATKTAADEAFSGLADSTERLAASSQQAAEALGAPFLGPLTLVTDGLASLSGKFAGFLEGDKVQATLKGLGIAAVGLLAAFKLIPAAVNALGLSRLATSGAVRGLGAGLMQGSGNQGYAGGLGRFLGGQGYIDNQNRLGGATPGSRLMAPVNERFQSAGAAVGRNIPNYPGPNPLRVLAGAGAQLGGVLLRSSSENVRNARLLGDQVGDRKDALAGRSAINKEFEDYKKQLDADRKSGAISGGEYRKQLAAGAVEVAAQTGKVGASFKLLGRELGSLAAQSAASTAAVGARVAKGAASGVQSLTGGLGGPLGIASTAALVGFQIKGAADEDRKKRLDEAKSATNFTDDYAVAIGKATEAVSTFGGAAEAQAKASIKSASSIEDAIAVSADDTRNAGALSKSQIRDFSQGTTEAVIRRLRDSIGGTGAGADEIQRIQADLLNSGRSNAEVRKISRAIPTEGNLDQDFTAGIEKRIADIASLPGRTGIRGALSKFDSFAGASRGTTVGTIDTLGEEQKTQAKDLIQNIQERQLRRQQTLANPETALATSIEEVDAAVQAAIKQGNASLVEDLQIQAQGDLFAVGKKRRGRTISFNEIERAGSYSEALAARDERFREGDFARANKAANDPARQREKDIGNAASKLAGNNLAGLFDYTATSDVARKVQQVTGVNGSPEDPRAQSDAIRAVIQNTREMGGSFQELASNALDAANKLGETGDAAQATITAIRAAAQQQIRFNQPFNSSGSNLRTEINQASAGAGITPGTTGTQAEQAQNVERLAAAEAQLIQRSNAAVSQQRSVDLQTSRMKEDFNLQMLYSDQDYRTQMNRQAEQYGIGLVRTEEQYLVGRRRALEGFNRQQMISQRDFAKQMRRSSEDAARAMYDPFQRIQVSGTWDPEMLFGNLDEQNEALARQISTLKSLREKGLSETSITLLALNDPKNAQQAAALADATAAQIDGLNRAAAARQQLGGKLNADPANLGRERSKEDFGQSLKDQNETMRISLKQGEEDYKRTLRLMSEDNSRALRLAGEDRDRFVQRSVAGQKVALDRMAEDVERANEEIVQNLEQAQKNMNAVINGEALDLTGVVKSSLDETADILQAWIDGSLSEKLRNLGDAMSTGFQNAASGTAAGAAAGLSGSDGTTGGRATNEGGSGTASMTAGGSSGLGQSGVAGQGYAVTSGFGPRRSPKKGASSNHKGADYAFPEGSKVTAFRDGKVSAVGERGGYGLLVDIEHGDGWMTRYGHLSKIGVSRGANVKQGAVIGLSGSTGNVTAPHLHFETRKNDKAVDPKTAKFALGGIVTGPTNAIIGEAGDKEAVIPLNRSGVEVLAQAMKLFMSKEDGKMMRSSNGVSYTTYDYSQTMNDNRMVVEHMELKAESPRELAMAMEAQRRRANLTNGGKKR